MKRRPPMATFGLYLLMQAAGIAADTLAGLVLRRLVNDDTR